MSDTVIMGAMSISHVYVSKIAAKHAIICWQII